MVSTNHDRLRRILRLALASPYEGEREKAVALLTTLLEKMELTLDQLDGTFRPDQGINELRKRAGLSALYTLTLKSREEASLYHHLVCRFTEAEDTAQHLIEGANGYELTFMMTFPANKAVELAFTEACKKLHTRLAAAQQQAAREYQLRRQVLFEETIQALAASSVSTAELTP